MTPEEKAVVDAALAWRTAILADPLPGSGNLPASVVDVLVMLGAATYRLSSARQPVRTAQLTAEFSPESGACSCDPAAFGNCASEGCRGGLDYVPPAWESAVLLYCLAGDRIRIGTEETDVLRSGSGVWYVNTENYWHPTPWRHTEVRLDLAANPGFLEYPPNTPCEIWCTPERRAVLALQQDFPGVTEVKRR